MGWMGALMSGGGGDKKGKDNSNQSLTPEAKQFHPSDSSGQKAKPESYHKGGKVKKSGKAKVKKGEEILTAKESKEYRKTKRKIASGKPQWRARKVSQRISKGSSKVRVVK